MRKSWKESGREREGGLIRETRVVEGWEVERNSLTCLNENVKRHNKDIERENEREMERKEHNEKEREREREWLKKEREKSSRRGGKEY